jgi:nucleoid-associated protein YgaU
VALEKAQLGGVPVLFNPSRYTLDRSNQIAEIAIPGLGAPILQFVRGNSRTLALELYLDTYEQGVSVADHTNAVYGLLAIDSSTHAPPITTFVWGRFAFRCVVDRVSGSFTLFLEDGTPVRATLNVTLREYVDVDQEVRGINLQSADHYKTRVVRQGDTISSIAADEYGDPTAWRAIADANALANPRTLTAGRLLVIPPLPTGVAS